jgi:curli biogenesis system outer membrane secretion channel CsgG
MKTLLLAVALSALPFAPASFAQDGAATAAAPAAAAAKFNLDTPIQDIVANPAAKAAFDAALPGVSTHESYEMFKGMSLNQLKAYAADQLTPEVLTKVEAALAAVK